MTSNGYYGRRAYTGYRGELAESDVVGAPVNPNGTVSEADIRRACTTAIRSTPRRERNSPSCSPAR